jgi:hypothetical protein
VGIDSKRAEEPTPNLFSISVDTALANTDEPVKSKGRSWNATKMEWGI